MVLVWCLHVYYQINTKTHCNANMVQSTRDYIAKASSCILNKHLQKPFSLCNKINWNYIDYNVRCWAYVDYAQQINCNFRWSKSENTIFWLTLHCWNSIAINMAAQKYYATEYNREISTNNQSMTAHLPLNEYRAKAYIKHFTVADKTQKPEIYNNWWIINFAVLKP